MGVRAKEMLFSYQVGGKRCVRTIQLVSLAGMLTAACYLYGQQPTELADAIRALYQGNYERSASLAENYLKSHPRSPAGRILLARAQIAQGKYPLAYQELRKVLRADPKNIDALYYLGQLSGILSQTEYQQLYALAPDSARVHQLLAESYRVQEKTDKAEEEYQAALKANPRMVEVLVALGDLTRSQFRFDEAISYYSRALEVEPRNYDSTYGLGACYHFRQEPQKAIEYFKRAVDIDPSSAAGRLALGDALLRADQPGPAVSELKSAVALEPEMRQAYSLLGRAHQKLGQSREAAEAFKRAQELIQSEMESRQGLFVSDEVTPTPPPSREGEVQPPTPKN
jgi:Tfp pilus assembly protein PilF